jgi:hypothetical protein
MVGDEAPVDGGEEEVSDEATDEPAEDEEEEEERRRLEQRKHKLKAESEYQPNVLGAKQLAESRVLVSKQQKNIILLLTEATN